MSIFTKFNKKDEWYTQDKDVENLLHHLKDDQIDNSRFRTIWCPFNDYDSAFKRVLEKHNFKVIATAGDFFDEFNEPEHYDLIVSNPPFSKKVEVLKRLNKLDKPFIMLFGTTALNNGSFLEELENTKWARMIFIKKRIIYFDKSKKPLKSPPFHSFWLCNIRETNEYEENYQHQLIK